MGQTNEHPFLILIIMSTFDPISSYDEQERRLLILYATETGNAQDIADRVARAARRLQFRSQIMSVDRYSLVCRFSIMVHIFCLKPFLSWQENLIIEELVIFVVSTTGSGIEPRSMTPLWNRLLSSRLPTDSFEDLSFAVFGLGDTSYEKFCWAAKLLSKRLKTLGATEICERGEGDEQHPLGWVFSFVIVMRYLYHHFYRLDGAFEPWVDLLSEAMLRLYPIPDTLPIASTSKLLPPRVTLKSPEEGVELVPLYPTGALPVTLNKNDRITAQDWDQDVRHIELKSEQDVKCVPSLRLSGRGLLQSSYLPGDIAIIHPLANSDEVQEFLVSINWDKMADEPLTVKERLGGSSHDRPYPLSCWVMYPRSKSSDFTFEYIYTQNALYLLPWFQCCAKENVFSVSSRLHFWWLRKRETRRISV